MRIGDRFHHLVLIEKIMKIAPNGTKRAYWRCHCDCGNKDAELRQDGIGNGKYKSCCRMSDRIPQENPRWKGVGDISGARFYQIRRKAIKAKVPFELTIGYVWQLFLTQNRTCPISGELMIFKILRN